MKKKEKRKGQGHGGVKVVEIGGEGRAHVAEKEKRRGYEGEQRAGRWMGEKGCLRSKGGGEGEGRAGSRGGG